MRTVVFASAQDLAYGPRATFMELKMRGLHGTDGPRALGEWFSRLRSRLLLTPCMPRLTPSAVALHRKYAYRGMVWTDRSNVNASAASFIYELNVYQLSGSLVDAEALTEAPRTVSRSADSGRSVTG